MSKSKHAESQQQSEGITIGTQGNDNQPTPHGDDIQYPQQPQEVDLSIPNQHNSSATNKRKADNERSQGD
jgi:hypothetical protein